MKKTKSHREFSCVNCGASLANRAPTAKYCSRQCRPQYSYGKTAKPKIETNVTARTCLCCQQEFPSKWSGNRVCDVCKTTSTWKRQTVLFGENG